MLQFLLMLLIWQSPPSIAPCQARIELQHRGDLLIITGHCRNLQPIAARYRYEMALQRESAGGHSRNAQRGEVSVNPHQEVSLSQTQVNAGPQDTYRIYLSVFDTGGRTLAQDSIFQTPAR